MPATSGFLTTHVLDTARGLPAAGLALELFRIDGDTRQSICQITTNDDGRTDQPLLPTDQFATGTYEIVFDVETYLQGQSGGGSSLSFYDKVPVRFRITDPERHYHVPLLISPFGYSTYRGS